MVYIILFTSTRKDFTPRETLMSGNHSKSQHFIIHVTISPREIWFGYPRKVSTLLVVTFLKAKLHRTSHHTKGSIVTPGMLTFNYKIAISCTIEFLYIIKKPNPTG